MRKARRECPVAFSRNILLALMKSLAYKYPTFISLFRHSAVSPFRQFPQLAKWQNGKNNGMVIPLPMIITCFMKIFS